MYFLVFLNWEVELLVVKMKWYVLIINEGIFFYKLLNGFFFIILID